MAGHRVLVNVSGRGDKDLDTVIALRKRLMKGGEKR
jgi:tryptophan synthase beta subunit